MLWYKVRYETNDKYREWIRFIESKWFIVVWIVCDWRKWLLWWFWEIPTQLCTKHFHSMIVRYLTNKPKHEATRELKEIWMGIWNFRENTINMWLNSRFERNKTRLGEKNNKGRNKHERAMKAYRSIRRNLAYCYIYERYNHIWIPKTNNSLESINSHLKTKSRIHRWLREDRKDKFINYYLYIS